MRLSPKAHARVLSIPIALGEPVQSEVGFFLSAGGDPSSSSSWSGGQVVRMVSPERAGRPAPGKLGPAGRAIVSLEGAVRSGSASSGLGPAGRAIVSLEGAV